MPVNRASDVTDSLDGINLGPSPVPERFKNVWRDWLALVAVLERRFRRRKTALMMAAITVAFAPVNIRDNDVSPIGHFSISKVDVFFLNVMLHHDRCN